MRVSEHLAQGQKLPRGDWHGVDPRVRVVPAKKGQTAPYRRKPRRQGERRILGGAANERDGT